jgi:hypothetical protein
MMIEAVGGSGLGGDGDGGRGLRSPVVGMGRVIGRAINVGRGRGERKGRQVGQFERFLFSAEGSVYGMRGGLFTVISILRGVCYGRIVSSGRGRVAHLRVTDDKAGLVSLRINSLSRANSLVAPCLSPNNPPFVSSSPTLILSRPLARRPVPQPVLPFLGPRVRQYTLPRNSRASTRRNCWPFESTCLPY